MEDRPWINIDLSSYKAAFEAKIRGKNSQKMFNTYVQTHSLKFGFDIFEFICEILKSYAHEIGCIQEILNI